MNISLYPMQDFYETKLSQSYNWTWSTMYVKATPSFTFPSWMKTVVVLNPWKTTQQAVIIDWYNASTKTLSVSSTSVNRWPWLEYTAQTHPVDSVVRISNNFAFFEAIVASLNSKPNTNDNALQIDWYASETARDEEITSPVSGKNRAYINDRWLWTKYIAWSRQDDSTWSTENAAPWTAGKVEIPTQLQVESWTDTWWTWAKHSVMPSQINPNNITSATPVASDKILFSDVSDSNKLKSSTLSMVLSLISLWYFWDGSDWDVTISTNTTLTRDMYYNNLVIDSWTTLTTAGYAVFVKGTVTGTWKISARGNNASGATAWTAQNAWTLNSNLVWWNGWNWALWSWTAARPWWAWQSQNPSYSNLTAINWSAWDSWWWYPGTGWLWGTAWTNTRWNWRNKLIPLARIIYQGWGAIAGTKYWIATNAWSGWGWCYWVPGNSWWSWWWAWGNGWIIHFYCKTFSFTWTVDVSWWLWWNGSAWVSISWWFWLGWGWWPWWNGWVFVVITSDPISTYTFTGAGWTWWTWWQWSNNWSPTWAFASSWWTGNTWFNIQITV